MLEHARYIFILVSFSGYILNPINVYRAANNSVQAVSRFETVQRIMDGRCW